MRPEQVECDLRIVPVFLAELQELRQGDAAFCVVQPNRFGYRLGLSALPAWAPEVSPRIYRWRRLIRRDAKAV